MTRRDEVFSDVVLLLENKCGIAPSEVNTQAGLFDDLGLDSLDLIAIAQVLQAKYQISLDNESIAAVRTVDDVITFVESSVAARTVATRER